MDVQPTPEQTLAYQKYTSAPTQATRITFNPLVLSPDFVNFVNTWSPQGPVNTSGMGLNPDQAQMYSDFVSKTYAPIYGQGLSSYGPSFNLFKMIPIQNGSVTQFNLLEIFGTSDAVFPLITGSVIVQTDLQEMIFVDSASPDRFIVRKLSPPAVPFPVVQGQAINDCYQFEYYYFNRLQFRVFLVPVSF